MHIKHKFNSTREEILERAVEAVKYAKRSVEDIEFYAEDAGRADIVYLAQMIEAVIAAGATVVNILLRSMEFRAIDLTLGVRRSCAVAAPRFVLAVPSNVAELVAAEAPTDSKVCGVWFTVKDLGLPDEAALAQSSRRVGAAKVKDDSGESCCRRSRWFYL